MTRTAHQLPLGLLLVLVPIAAGAQSEMPANCPMHAEHQKRAAEAVSPTAPVAVATAAPASEHAEHAGHVAHAATAAPASPYVGFTDRAIAALSEEEIAALRSGAGHGFALPAELNRYPGPRHLLDLAAELGLDASTTRKLQTIYDRMHGEAVPLGERIVAGERELDWLFAGGRVTSAEVVRLTAEIARLRGELRAAHLVAHVEARALLSADQVARYDALRGYASPAGAP